MRTIIHAPSAKIERRRRSPTKEDLSAQISAASPLETTGGVLLGIPTTTNFCFCPGRRSIYQAQCNCKNSTTETSGEVCLFAPPQRSNNERHVRRIIHAGGLRFVLGMRKTVHLKQRGARWWWLVGAEVHRRKSAGAWWPGRRATESLESSKSKTMATAAAAAMYETT